MSADDPDRPSARPPPAEGQSVERGEGQRVDSSERQRADRDESGPAGTHDATGTSAEDGENPRVEVYPGREVVVEFDPDLTFECVDGCTWCCHHGVLLYDRDLRALAERANLGDATTTFRGERFVRRESKDHDHAGEDGAACYFLTDEGLCSLQADHDWKPSRCSVFPLRVFVENDEIHVDVRDSAREHCEGLNVSERRVIDELAAFLPEGLWELDDPSTRREL